MGDYTATVDVEVPVRTAYDQWTQFESFPSFMEGVESVTQVDDSTTEWSVEIGGVRRDFEAAIVEQTPDARVAWASTDGPWQSGEVTFAPIGPSATRVDLRMTFEPQGFLENAGDALGIVERRVEGDLERFKSFIEERGLQTGSWRGEI